MVHNILIVLHAIGGGVSLIIGCEMLFLLVRRRDIGDWTWTLFLGFLALMLIPLIAVIGVDWPGLDLTARITFSALGVLGLYMAWRAYQAHRVRNRRTGGWKLEFTDHTGFNLISLWDGFVIVLAIDLGAPGWLVGLLAVVGVAVGIISTNAVKARISRT